MMDERLTEKDNIGAFHYDLKNHTHIPGEFGTYDAFFNYHIAIKRLGEYEDAADGIDFKRLQEFCKAEQEGRLEIRPCNVGDKVYAISGCFYLPQTKRLSTDIIECRVRGFKRTAQRNAILLVPCIEEACNRRSAYKWFTLTAIGKTVFLTKEQAEDAFKPGDKS